MGKFHAPHVEVSPDRQVGMATIIAVIAMALILYWNTIRQSGGQGGAPENFGSITIPDMMARLRWATLRTPGVAGYRLEGLGRVDLQNYDYIRGMEFPLGEAGIPLDAAILRLNDVVITNSDGSWYVTKSLVSENETAAQFLGRKLVATGRFTGDAIDKVFYEVMVTDAQAVYSPQQIQLMFTHPDLYPPPPTVWLCVDSTRP